MKFSIKNFLSKYEQIYNFLRICSHLLKKSLSKKIHFYAVNNIFKGTFKRFSPPEIPNFSR